MPDQNDAADKEKRLQGRINALHLRMKSINAQTELNAICGDNVSQQELFREKDSVVSKLEGLTEQLEKLTCRQS